MKYSWIIFDADDTLFDYDKAEQGAMSQTFQQFDIALSENTINIYRSINGSLFSQFERGEIAIEKLKTERFARLFQELGMPVNSKSFATAYQKNLSQNQHLLPGAEDVIKELSKTFNLIMLTNGLASVQRTRLGDSVIGHFFKDLVISEEEGYSKPSREIFEITFARMGDPPREQVLMVGDSLTSDIAGGNNYGIDTCWYCPKAEPRQPSPATYRITSLADLHDIVK